MSGTSDSESPDQWGPATQAVRGGMTRSPFGETAEAMFLTQSFVYDSAEAANARFAGDNPGYIYSRYANPTVKMFEDRLALIEGAEFCRSTASGMAAIFTALSGLVRAGTTSWPAGPCSAPAAGCSPNISPASAWRPAWSTGRISRNGNRASVPIPRRC